MINFAHESFLRKRVRRSPDLIRSDGIRWDCVIPFTNHVRTAFTLIELMVVVTIIGILATLSLYVVGSAQHSARVHATEAKIARLDHIMTELYESYVYRRMPVTDRNPRTAAQTRLKMIHDTMRMEMPNNWVEALTGPQVAGLSDSPLRKVYENAFRKVAGDFTISNGVITLKDTTKNLDTFLKNEEAKLLYLIIMNAVPEARDMVGEKGIASDESQLSYFVDGWENPIHFLRWAPGFSGSDRQPDLWKWTGEDQNIGSIGGNQYATYWHENCSPDILKDDQLKPGYAFITEDKQEIKEMNIYNAIKNYPDPFDPMKARPCASASAGQDDYKNSRPGFMLVPLIFSAGQDGKTGIEGYGTGIVLDPFAKGYGAPDGDLGYHYDNIHNHVLGGR